MYCKKKLDLQRRSERDFTLNKRDPITDTINRTAFIRFVITYRFLISECIVLQFENV